MEEGVLSMSNFVGNSCDTFMDFDYIDELLLDGCWLEAKESELPQFDYTAPISPFEPSSFVWPSLEQNDAQRWPNEPHSAIGLINSSPEAYSIEESSKRWWIEPRPSVSVMERLIQALRHIKSCSAEKDMLIQVWIPVTRGGKRVLTTNNQPFMLDLNCPILANYRDISVNYQFAADEDSKEVVGLPGRVFKSKVPEWTPDVRFFSREEYPRVGHAQQYGVRGTLAVPVLERGSRSCLGVIEVVLTQQKIQYRPELESVCNALQAVDLRCTDASCIQKTCDLSYQSVLPEILDVLRSACENHGLPLAQTWVLCLLQGKGGCMHSVDNLNDCLAPVESASFVGDPRIQGFHEACSEHHLLKGQGIVGTAFQTNQPCFSPDVSSYSKTDYPLSHHARMFGLKAAVAIRLRSTRTGLTDFVLEFFLPTNCNKPEEHKKMLNVLSTLIQNVCRTLRVVSEKELLEEYGSSPDRGETCQINEEVPKVDRSRQVIQENGIGKSSSDTRVPCDGSSLYTTRKGAKRRTKAEKTITLQVLKQHFAGSLKDAAKNLGVCPTTLKRICRQLDIQRWPSRKIKKVGHSLQKIRRVMDSVQGTSGGLQIESFYTNFPELTSSRTNPNPLESTFVKSASPSSSCSQSSNTSQCYSSGGHPFTVENPVLKQEQVPAPGVLKQTNLDLRCDKPKALPRIKVTFGEDTIRFRMQQHWRYKDLLNEISRRFGVECDTGGFHLKYLDDDSEWVLLTCDADLEECIDVCSSSPNQPIRLSFLPDSQSQSSVRGPKKKPCSL